MDPVSGGGPKPVTTTATERRTPQARAARSGEAPASRSSTSVYVGPRTGPLGGLVPSQASRAQWPSMPPIKRDAHFGEATVDHCQKMLDKLDRQLDKLGHKGKDAKKAQDLQREYDRYMKIMNTISEIWKSENDAIQAAIRNIK
jgi:hypothetical protein